MQRNRREMRIASSAQNVPPFACDSPSSHSGSENGQPVSNDGQWILLPYPCVLHIASKHCAQLQGVQMRAVPLDAKQPYQANGQVNVNIDRAMTFDLGRSGDGTPPWIHMSQAATGSEHDGGSMRVTVKEEVDERVEPEVHQSSVLGSSHGQPVTSARVAMQASGQETNPTTVRAVSWASVDPQSSHSGINIKEEEEDDDDDLVQEFQQSNSMDSSHGQPVNSGSVAKQANGHSTNPTSFPWASVGQPGSHSRVVCDSMGQYSIGSENNDENMRFAIKEEADDDFVQEFPQSNPSGSSHGQPVSSNSLVGQADSQQRNLLTNMSTLSGGNHDDQSDALNELQLGNADQGQISSTGQSLYQCSLCTGSYSKITYLKNHIFKMHRQELNAKNQCSQCGRLFCNSNDVQRHMERMHQTNQNFKCTQCNKTFGRSTSLREHINVHHYGLLLYTCTEDGCDKSFGYFSNFSRHKHRCHRQKTVQAMETDLSHP